MRARRSLVHERARDSPTGLSNGKKGANLIGRRERDNINVCDGCPARLVVLDLVLLLVELSLAKQVVDSFIILRIRLNLINESDLF